MDKSIEDKGLENMQEEFQCKITVLRKLFHEDLYQQNPYGHAGSCGVLEEGQVFSSDSRWYPPKGFCPWAWSDLQPMIHAIHAGSKTSMISCCTDGLRPVIFKLERASLSEPEQEPS